jgi:molybdenum cofactor cytidylyltransferase
MGVPKQALRYQGETLLGRAVSAALNSRRSPVIVVLGSAAETLRGELSGTEAHAVINSDWAEGMASSIRCGIAALEDATSGGSEAAILTLCDQPFVTSEVFNRLVEAYQKSRPPIVASTYEVNGEVACGVPALFGRALFPELLALQGAEGAKRIITRHQDETISIPTPEAAFDVDTPDHYRILQRA